MEYSPSNFCNPMSRSGRERVDRVCPSCLFCGRESGVKREFGVMMGEEGNGDAME